MPPTLFYGAPDAIGALEAKIVYCPLVEPCQNDPETFRTLKDQAWLRANEYHERRKRYPSAEMFSGETADDIEHAYHIWLFTEYDTALEYMLAQRRTRPGAVFAVSVPERSVYLPRREADTTTSLRLRPVLLPLKSSLKTIFIITKEGMGPITHCAESFADATIKRRFLSINR